MEEQGSLLIDGERVEIGQGDLQVSLLVRTLNASAEAVLFVICAGGVAEGYRKDPNSRYLIDDVIPHYDHIPSSYQDNPDVIHRNVLLKERLLKAWAKRESSKHR